MMQTPPPPDQQETFCIYAGFLGTDHAPVPTPQTQAGLSLHAPNGRYDDMHLRFCATSCRHSIIFVK